MTTQVVPTVTVDSRVWAASSTGPSMVGAVHRDPGPSWRRKGGKKALFISTIKEPPGHGCSVCFKVPSHGLSLVCGCPSECLGPSFKPGPAGDLRRTSLRTQSCLGAAELHHFQPGEGMSPEKPRDIKCFGHCPDTHSWSRAGSGESRKSQHCTYNMPDGKLAAEHEPGVTE